MPTCPDSVKRLIERFTEQTDQVCSPDYNETQVRIDFIDPFMAALGWDMNNKAGHAMQYRDVVHEDRVKVGGQTKAPDYSFRIGGTRKFFLEAKKPSVKIKTNVEPAYQLRRYAWSAKLPVSILTDFQEFAVYDGRIRPKYLESAAKARREYFTYTEYEDRWDFIEGTFSKDAVLRGAFDRYAETKKGRGAQEFDDVFLEEIEEWRKLIANNLALRNKTIDEHALNFSVQRIIDRIIFLRIAEDRGSEQTDQLKDIAKEKGVYAHLVALFKQADDRYNSGLFHFQSEKARDQEPDTLTPALNVDDKTLKSIIDGLYYPQSPYVFNVVTADLLGSVYERFLGKVITLTKGHRAKIEEKPEVRKAGGVYYTPTYIVDYIVKNTVGKLLEGKTPKQAEKIKVLDPACGSGSFLIGAYDYLLRWYEKQYIEDTKKDPKKHTRGKSAKLRQTTVDPLAMLGEDLRKERELAGYTLTIAERKRILLTHIHGVDLDHQAVEVSKLNLLLKCLEGETRETLGFSHIFSKTKSRERALPDLGHNILCGNSLIGTDIIGTDAWDEMSEDERECVNPFDYENAFVDVFKGKNGGFDTVIGNPPYIDSEWMSVHWPTTRSYCVNHYEAASGNWDMFCVFLDVGMMLCKPNGSMSMIVPNKLATAGYAAGARVVLSENSQLLNLRDYSRAKVFPVAVYPIVVTSRKSTKSISEVLIERVSEEERGRLKLTSASVPYSGFSDARRGWDLSLSAEGRDLVNKIVSKSKRLGDIAQVLGSATVSEAYQLSEILSESESDSGETRVINSGTIDRYCDLWGVRDMRYIKRKYSNPVVSASNENKLPHRRKEQSKTPKIIIAGMTLRLECTLDSSGNTLAAKSTSIVFGDINLTHLVAILNSNLMRFVYDQEFGGDKLQGGYLRVGPPQLSRLPIVTVKGAYSKSITASVRRMISLLQRLNSEQHPQKRTQLQREIDATDRKIDQLVYELYGLTDDEIALVEEATAKS